MLFPFNDDGAMGMVLRFPISVRKNMPPPQAARPLPAPREPASTPFSLRVNVVESRQQNKREGLNKKRVADKPKSLAPRQRKK
jgi:hypothetical protein